MNAKNRHFLAHRKQSKSMPRKSQADLALDFLNRPDVEILDGQMVLFENEEHKMEEGIIANYWPENEGPEEQNREFKGVWIPAWFYFNSELSWLDKILILEIDSLDRDDRGCFADNKYLGLFIGISGKRVANVLTKLKRLDWVRKVWSDGRRRGLSTRLKFGRFERESRPPGNGNGKADLPETGKQDSRKRESPYYKDEKHSKRTVFAHSASERAHTHTQDAHTRDTREGRVPESDEQGKEEFDSIFGEFFGSEKTQRGDGFHDRVMNAPALVAGQPTLFPVKTRQRKIKLASADENEPERENAAETTEGGNPGIRRDTHQSIFHGFYKLCFFALDEKDRKLLTSSQKGQVAGVVAALRDAAADLDLIYEFQAFWKKHWRSRDKSGNYQPPMPIRVQELWPEFISNRTGNRKPEEPSSKQAVVDRAIETALLDQQMFNYAQQKLAEEKQERLEREKQLNGGNDNADIG